ncbi:MAG: hypothetical protein EVJ47_06465 [Candidatus Acidulodesulfobacterium ferriphilum]|uniref:RepB/MobA-like C-terminal domain-containing protein n=1 Tax=Candidatus Acidulodesulfobacterium ferriphilum TaxID=2597223 RepID=A0A519BAJ8_9DELT|nr:MAG: hypothetical protein EVJ47_06465 [Candidatus Acidulodesulfobacterium ferriphilum]
MQGIENGLIELPERHIATPPALQAGRKKAGNTGCYKYIKKVYDGGNTSDISAIDFKAAKYAILKGFNPNDIKKAIMQYSPDIVIRKKGHIEDYLSRTLKNASARL